MATYYVNLSASVNGGGTSRVDPYNALSALPTLAAGDIVEIEPGTSQTMSGTYTVSGSGTSGNPIIIRANPAVSGAKPRFRVSAEAGVGITVTGRSHVRIENLNIVGESSWTSQDTAAIRLNGALTSIVLSGVDAQFARFDLVGGFATNGVTFENCSARDCRSDGLRWFSGTGSYTWQNVAVLGGTYSGNGLAQGSNGAGLSFFIQSGHTGTTFQDLTIRGVRCENNYRAGISANDGAVAWATIIATANTTPPGQRFTGVTISNNVIMNNGGAGISLLGAKPSASMRVQIAQNYVQGNSERTTLGNIWTGGCQSPLIEWNVCIGGKSNGTSVGDGQGIFDDQWNDGAIVRYNLIESNVYDPAVNPDYTAYGIGIYRASNSNHYSNVIRNCRHGFVIGYPSGATAPTMTGIKVDNNTISNTARFGISIWTATPSSSLTIRNNLIVDASQDIEAQSSGAGAQTYSGNAAIGVTTKYTGNSVGSGAVDHASYTRGAVTSEAVPVSGAALLSGGADIGYVRDIRGIQSKKHQGAFAKGRML